MEITKAPVWQAVTASDPRFARNEPLVAGYVLTDFLSGEDDCAPVIQALLDRLHEAGGGTLFCPAGEYVCRTPIRVPIGVTLLGEWECPNGNNAIEGTLLVWRGPALSEEFDTPFISLSHSSCIRGVSFWYPELTVENPTPYPAAVRTAHWATAREITLINAWVGIEQLLGDSPSMYDIYGTALSIGIYDERVSDIMRVERTRFAPDYWLSSGRFEGDESALRAYLLAHATGAVFKRTDWSYYTDSEVEGYAVGVEFNATNCYGQSYNVTVKHCACGIRALFTHGNGQALTNWRIEGCDRGIHVPADATFAAMLLQDVLIQAKDAVVLEHNCKVSLIDCTVSGTITAAQGMLLLMNNRFATPLITLSGAASLVAVGNDGLAKQNIRITEEALCTFDPEKADIVTYRATAKETAAMQIAMRFPSAREIYVAALDNSGATDVTAALNALLAKAGETGGTVYLPSGHYRLDSTVYVPSGVQLRGAADLCQMAYNTATVLDIHHTAHGVELSASSGLAALTFCHVLQSTVKMVETGKPLPHDFAVYAKNAPDSYVQNVSFLNAYNGILFDGCDRHYVDGVGGTFLNQGIVAKDSLDPVWRNVQLNYQPLARGHEWPQDLLLKGVEGASKIFFQQIQGESEIFVLDNVRDAMVWGCFTYCGGNTLVTRGENTTATVIGFGGDYVTRALVAHGGERITLVNWQSTAFVYTSYTLTELNDVYDIWLRDTFRGVVEMVNAAPRQLPQVVFQVEGGTLQVTNLNVASGIPYPNTHIEKAVFSHVSPNAQMTVCGVLQYSPDLAAEDVSMINGGFCGSYALIEAKNMAKSTERFGE